MIVYLSATLPKDDPMQIDKPLTEQKKERWYANNFCLYYGEPSHVTRECPKKHGPHTTRAICVTNPQLEELKNKHVQS
jgi:hypothetical protein